MDPIRTRAWTPVLAFGCLAALAAGCGCTQNVTFLVGVEDHTGSSVAGADVVCECDDLDGSLRRASGTTDEDGAAWIRVVAPSRDCPEDAGLMSSYFSRCVLTANRDGFQDGSFTLSGQDIDRLDDPDQGGHKVAVRIVLQPE